MATSTAKKLAVDLPAEIFDVQTNVPLIHQVVVAQLAAARQGTHATKTRGMVSGGGKKPYRQKGTGRARQGSIRAPQFTGGGTAHGPQPRDYVQRTPKKMKAAALRGALSDRARHGRVHVVEALVAGAAPSTKQAAALLDGFTERKNLLVVLDRSDIVSMKSVRNLRDLHVIAVDQLNTYDVLCSDDIVFTKAAFDTFVAGPVKGSDVMELAEAPAPAAEVPTGAVAALADGTAPEGYTVKGNADSGLYHEPGGRWYEQTVAEFWFKSAKDAEKAGFTKAGAKKAGDDK